MSEYLRDIAAWFLGEADKLDKLDTKIRAAITTQNRRAFYYGIAVGLILAVLIVGVI
jgi:hypothetical protein